MCPMTDWCPVHLHRDVFYHNFTAKLYSCLFYTVIEYLTVLECVSTSFTIILSTALYAFINPAVIC